ncbi:MAG: hypothetical protein JXA99_07960 [Candidatus Lokiarchaeota archaeon]|nr:hypothetical protein [Candidatus Lokiarchaeota archaeon]
MDGDLFQEGAWISNIPIEILVNRSELSPGVHNFTMIVSDSIGGTSEKTLQIIVGVPPLNLGDANNDGIINIVDSLMIAQYYVGWNLEGFHLENSDVNGDGMINIVDSLLVAQFYVGIITSFPYQE